MKSVQFSFFLQRAKILLPQRFVEHDRHGIGQIQASVSLPHRDADTGLLVIHQDLFRNSCAFFSEHNVIIRAKRYIRVSLMRLCCGIPDLRSRVFRHEILIIRICVDIQILPIIQSGAADLFLSDLKPERFDQMKGRSRDYTGTSDIAGIAGYFRLM